MSRQSLSSLPSDPSIAVDGMQTQKPMNRRSFLKRAAALPVIAVTPLRVNPEPQIAAPRDSLEAGTFSQADTLDWTAEQWDAAFAGYLIRPDFK